MTNLLPDDSYCTSDMGRYLFRSKSECPCSVSLHAVAEETTMGVAHLAYTLDFKFLPIESLLAEPRTFRLVTRYKEVNKLQAALSKLHKQLYLRGTFPAFPSPKLFGKPDETQLEERKRAILQVFEFLADSEVLRKARLFQEFVQKAIDVVPEAVRTDFQLPAVEFHDDLMSDDIPPLLPTPIDLPDHQSSRSNSDASSATPPSQFQFPDLPLNFDVAEVSDYPTSAIRRFLQRMPLTSPFSSQVATSSQDDSPTGAYLLRAAQLVSTAQRAELEREYELAFHCLKQAAHILIQGLQDEKDVSLRNVVRRKTAKYLVRAERIYRSYLSYDGTQFNFEALYASSLQDPNIMAFQCSNSQLKNYHIIGVTPGIEAEKRVFIVEEGSTKQVFVMKLLEKGEETLDSQQFLPTHVPHMTTLHKFFQTEVFIILVLEYIETGRLWTFLRNYFAQKQAELGARIECNCKCEESPNNNDDQTCYLKDYRGRRILFAVAIDTERLARMSQQALDAEGMLDDVASELCTVGVDVAASVAEGTVIQSLQSEILVPGPRSSDEDAILHVEEEAPAPLCLKSVSKEPEKENMSLRNALAECSAKLTRKFERTWDPSQLLPECLIVHWTAQIVSTLYVLHTLGEFVCDLLPDNLLIGADGNLVLTAHAVWNQRDLALARFQHGYSAPECFCFPLELSPAADVWTLGAFLFELISGYPLAMALPKYAGQASFDLFSTDDVQLSFTARDLLCKILLHDPEDRLSLDAIRSHAFFQTINWHLYDNPHSPKP